MPTGGPDQRVVRRQGHAPAGGHQGNVAGGCLGVNLVVMTALNIDHLAAVAFWANPLEVHAERLLAEPAKKQLLRVILATDLLAPPQANDVRIDGGVVLGGEAVQLANSRFWIADGLLRAEDSRFRRRASGRRRGHRRDRFLLGSRIRRKIGAFGIPRRRGECRRFGESGGAWFFSGREVRVGLAGAGGRTKPK